MRAWSTTDELLDMIAAEAAAGRHVRLSPQTAMSLVGTARAAEHLLNPPGGPGKYLKVRLYEEGSCIYRFLANGDIDRLEAWARSSVTGRATLASLEKQYPSAHFEQRRRAWVEGKTVPERK